MKGTRGKIISDKMPLGAVVEVATTVAHPLYKKRVRREKKFHAVNSIGAKTGQEVLMEQCRPISRTKNWKIIKIVTKTNN